MEISVKLQTKQSTKKGHPLQISIFNSVTDRLYKNLGYHSTPEQWDFKREEPKQSHPLYPAIMSLILEIRTKTIQLQNTRQKKNAQQVYEFIFGKNDNFYSFWEQRISEIKNHATATAYQNTLLEFRRYRKTVYFEDVDYNFLNGFKRLKKDTCSANGINTYLKNIRAVYNEGIRRGVYTPSTFVSPFNKIMEKPEKTQNKYLTVDDIRKIWNKPEKSKYDYYFLLSFLLGGADFVDIANLKKSHISGNRIVFKRFKGGTNEIIDNFIFPEAWEIINRFDEDEFLTDIHSYKSFISCRENFTKRYRCQLSEIEITSYFSSKSARYSFINIGKELMLNRDVIMELTGHSKNDVHSIYEGKFPNHIKDDVHRQIIEAVTLY